MRGRAESTAPRARKCARRRRKTSKTTKTSKTKSKSKSTTKGKTKTKTKRKAKVKRRRQRKAATARAAPRATAAAPPDLARCQAAQRARRVLEHLELLAADAADVAVAGALGLPVAEEDRLDSMPLLARRRTLAQMRHYQDEAQVSAFFSGCTSPICLFIYHRLKIMEIFLETFTDHLGGGVNNTVVIINVFFIILF